MNRNTRCYVIIHACIIIPWNYNVLTKLIVQVGHVPYMEKLYKHLTYKAEFWSSQVYIIIYMRKLLPLVSGDFRASKPSLHAR